MFNQFTGIGNLAADPEIRYAQSGTAVANYTVCCEGGYGEHKYTEFVRCVSFGKLAEIVGEYLSKGKRCFIQGEMQTRQWDDKDGNKRYTTEIKVSTMKMLAPKGEAVQNTPESQIPNADMNSDTPF